MPQRLFDLEAEERIKREREDQSTVDAGTERRSEAREPEEDAGSSEGDSPQNRRDRA
jgi:hypothetical protein